MPHAGLILSTCKLLCCVTSTLYLGAAVCLALVRLSLQLKHNKHRWVALTTTNILRIPQALSTALPSVCQRARCAAQQAGKGDLYHANGELA